MVPHIVDEYSDLFGQLNKETQAHSLNVGELCAACAPLLNLDKELLFRIGFLHDVGKIFIPSRILKKNAALTVLEREIVDLHSYCGYKMLKERGETDDVCVPVLYHHGFNKPCLKTPDVVLTSEMVGVISLLHAADIYDAMAKRRVYHEPFGHEEIISELSKDPLCTADVVEAIERYGAAVRENNPQTKILKLKVAE